MEMEPTAGDLDDDILHNYYFDFPSPPSDFTSPAALDLDLSPQLPPPPPSGSAFVRYECPNHDAGHVHTIPGKKGAQMRLAEFLRKMWVWSQKRAMVVEGGEVGVGGGSSTGNFQHMMRERQRRERLSQAYADLFSIVSPMSKGDKNSIVRSTAAYLRILTAKIDQLLARNRELRARTQAIRMIKFCVGNASSPIESLIAAINCIKAMGIRVIDVRSTFSSGRELSVTIATEPHLALREVERAVEEVLVEVERKARGDLPALPLLDTCPRW